MRPSPEDLALLRGLVEIPSTSRREGEAVEWLVARMSERGFRASVDDAGNAVGEIGAGPKEVVLLGHIDTVPGEIPVRIEGDELIGRGAVDAKGPLAAFVAAATKVVDGVRVIVVGAVEEESPTSAGARYRATLAAPYWCVIGEPSGWDAITVAYKGRLVLRIALTRDARHGAAPGPTVAEEGLALWERLRVAAAGHATSSRAFDRLDCRLEAVSTKDPDGLAERAELRVGYRLPPGIDHRDVTEQALTLVRAGVAGRERSVLDITVDAAEQPVRTSRTTPLARAFARAIADEGGQAAFKEKSGTSDMNLLAPSWRCPMVAYGPGDSRYDHTPIERLPLGDYVRAISVLQGVLRRATDRII
ncbi:MAG: [LysW]-lysine hydrolase [Chloroflexi bacterium]|nr:MAG: [LysW]-lysine hydrolase [Chloroflexota bacterium]TMG70634.1 MAG: [LysW]-lysine hydrolase [Chloroflexota bacterium]